MKFRSLLLIGSFLSCGLTSCKVTVETNSFTWVDEPKMTVEYSEYIGYTASIVGVAQNISGKKINYAQVSFSLYDANDINLGSAYDNVTNLNIGDKWQVDAKYFNTSGAKPVRFVFNKFTDIIY